jgi:hypothetical protein
MKQRRKGLFSFFLSDGRGGTGHGSRRLVASVSWKALYETLKFFPIESVPKMSFWFALRKGGRKWS